MESIMFRIMNLTELFRLEEEIEQLEDVQEREARSQLMEQLKEKITDYDVHVREYAYKQEVQALIARGIILESVEREPVIAEWDKQFASLVSLGKKKSTKYYSDQFRWHLFSFELLPAIQGDEARQMFNSTEKNELYLFFDYANDAYRIKNAQLLKAEDFDKLNEFSPLDYSDLYFFDPVNKWTYIKPHEDDCGPYYFNAK